MDYWFWNYNNVLNCKFLSLQVSQDMGIEAPIPISSKMGDTNNVFRRIVTAAEHPHLSIPETEAGRSRKQYNRLVNRSLMFVSGMLVFGTPRIACTWKM
jgi:Ras family protein T1